MKISTKMTIFRTFQQNFANSVQNRENLRKSEKIDFGAVQRFANLVDLEKCCNQYFVAKIGVDTAEPSKV